MTTTCHAAAHGGSTVRSLALVNSGSNSPGLRVESNGNTVVGCYVGLRADGLTALPNKNGGVAISGNNNTFGGATAADANVVSGNDDLTGTPTQANGGVNVRPGSGNMIRGNLIGTDAAGSLPLGNRFSGINITSASNNQVIGNRVFATIGAPGVFGTGIVVSGASSNLISGNTSGAAGGLANLGNGITLLNGANGNTVTGNAGVGNQANGVRIADAGTTANVVTANILMLNGASGVAIQAGATNNTVASNNIANNTAFGVTVTGTGASNNLVRDNGIALNGGGGVQITGGATNNTLRGNSIMNHLGCGVVLSGSGTSGNVATANGIAMNAAGGVQITNGASGNTVGAIPIGFPPFPPFPSVPPVVGNALAASYVSSQGSFNLAAMGMPFGANANTGLFVASEDVNGDGIDDMIFGRATGSTDVIVLDSATGAQLLNLSAVFGTFQGGVFVG